VRGDVRLAAPVFSQFSRFVTRSVRANRARGRNLNSFIVIPVTSAAVLNGIVAQAESLLFNSRDVSALKHVVIVNIIAAINNRTGIGISKNATQMSAHTCADILRIKFYLCGLNYVACAKLP